MKKRRGDAFLRDLRLRHDVGAKRALDDGLIFERRVEDVAAPTSEDFEPADLSSRVRRDDLRVLAVFFHFVKISKDHLCSGTPRIFFGRVVRGAMATALVIRRSLIMLLWRNFPFRGLGRVDEVEDEDSHNKGAEGVEQDVAEAHRGARAASTACWGLFACLWQRLDASRPPKTLAAAVGR